MSQDFSFQISELICTRISHDLIGNIGAVANAVELLDDDPESVSDVKPILEISSKVLSSRLKFFRLAFGLNNAIVKNVEELNLIATDYLQTLGNRSFPIQLNLQIKTPQLYKITLLSIMILSDVFIKGGTITATEKDNGIEFTANSENPLSVSKLNTLQSCLEGHISDENPAQNAPLIYMQDILTRSNISIKLSFTDYQASLQIN